MYAVYKIRFFSLTLLASKSDVISDDNPFKYVQTNALNAKTSNIKTILIM